MAIGVLAGLLVGAYASRPRTTVVVMNNLQPYGSHSNHVDPQVGINMGNGGYSYPFVHATQPSLAGANKSPPWTRRMRVAMYVVIAFVTIGLAMLCAAVLLAPTPNGNGVKINASPSFKSIDI